MRVVPVPVPVLFFGDENGVGDVSGDGGIKVAATW